MLPQNTLNEYIVQSLRDNWEQLALTDFNGVSFQFKDVARKMAKLHIMFRRIGIKRGDKIAICGKNSSQWAVAFFATLTYGAVAVPILSDFKPDNIHNIICHSESSLLFVDMAIWENLDSRLMPDLDGALLIQDYSLLLSRKMELADARARLNEYFGREYPERFLPSDVAAVECADNDLAMINYTSGSTGFSKGVMLSHKNVWSNVQFTIDGLKSLFPGDSIVSMLPMAHMYGLVVELIHPFVKGVHVHFLTRTPSPRVIMEAFAEVRPKLIVSVPLIIEKIIKTKVFPLLERPLMRILMHVPFVDDRLLAKIKQQLSDAFGGRLEEMIIGGAGLNKDVEIFLRRIGFPFTVGYGMTECAPLISYAPWHEARQGSCGRVVDRMEVRVDSSDPENIPGVLWTRGANVMLGYYKNPNVTAEVFDDGGWMSTGDIGTLDSDNFIYLRGRDKNMILGSSGQNIYPEEIEQKLNNMPFVCESIVIDESGRLVALVYPDYESAGREHLSDEQLSNIMDENIATLNKELPSYSQIGKVKMMSEEFEKTPKRSIKRYLYQHG